MATHTDPVCGMSIEESSAAATREYAGQKIYFCAVGCAEAFDREPTKYVTSAPAKKKSWFRRG